MAAYEEMLECVVGSAGGLHEETGVREGGVVSLPGELHLQALWFSGQMGREFITVDGRQVRVVQFGHWNHSAGPDFLHAVVEIDGERLHGELELDHRLSDWEAHGHAVNAAFNGVVLHVVFVDRGKSHFTRTSEHRQVAQVVVPGDIVREALAVSMGGAMADVTDAHSGRCCAPLAEMKVGAVESLMMEAVRHRAGVKARRRLRAVDVLGEDEWLWQALAETMGYRPNSLAMTLLAQRLPVRDLVAMPGISESVIFGAAGFLSAGGHESAEKDSREYLRELWDDWWQVRHHYEPVLERAIPWQLSGIRPVNHPQRRLGCLARVAGMWKEFSSACQNTAEVDEFLAGLGHGFWSHHYTLKSKRTEKRLALVGSQRIRDFQINHLLPVRLITDDPLAWSRFLDFPAPAVSDKVQKASVRLFGNSEKRERYLKKAWQHQALLQIYQDFCLKDVSDCADCPFPEQLMQWSG